MYYLPQSRLISCHFIMSRIYVRKTSWEQDAIKESVIMTQEKGGMEVCIPLLSYSKNNITADKVFLFLVFKLEV